MTTTLKTVSKPAFPRSDQDAPPMTAADLKSARRVPRVTSLRRALKMTQNEFAEMFKIPVRTLQDWEQERATPDAAARTYLQLITIDARAVLAILAKAPARV